MAGSSTTMIKGNYESKPKEKGKNMSTLEAMTNKDLTEYCKAEGIDVNSKNVSKPTKTELLDAIKKFELSQSEGVSAEVKDELEEEMTDADDFLAVDDLPKKEEKKEKKEKMTRAERKKIQHDELMPLIRVLVTSNATNQTQVNLHYVTWGNGLIGHNTDRVFLGKPWHVREGALRNLEQAVITEPVQDEEGNQVRFETKPAFNIRRLNPLTKAELDTIAKRQLIRSASIEQMI